MTKHAAKKKDLTIFLGTLFQVIFTLPVCL